MEQLPRSASDVEQWGRENQIEPREARLRFASATFLFGLAAVKDLQRRICFKGGNALRFVYGSPRSTIDFDFSEDHDADRGESELDDEEKLKRLIEDAVLACNSRVDIRYRLQRFARKPRTHVHSRATYQMSIGFAFPGSRRIELNDARPFPETINLEISVNDLVCGAETHKIKPQNARIRVCSIEDIVAEKLRALLQQVIRNRHRPGDVFDIAWIQRNYELDRPIVAQYLIAKCSIRDIRPTAASYDEEVRRRAEVDYDEQIREATGDSFIPFDEAWADVIGLVNALSPYLE